MIPQDKQEMIRQGDDDARLIQDQWYYGFLSDEEKSRLLVQHWMQIVEQVEKKIKASDDKSLKVTKITVWLPYENIHKYIKRFDFLATTELTKYVDTIDVIDEFDNESDD